MWEPATEGILSGWGQGGIFTDFEEAGRGVQALCLGVLFDG